VTARGDGRARASYPRKREGDRWELRAYVGLDPDTGRQRYIYGSAHGGVREARRAQGALERRALALRAKARPLAGGRPRPAKPRHERTVADAVEAWFERESPHWEPNGRDNVRNLIDFYVLPDLGGTQLWRLRGEIEHNGDDEPDPLLVSLTEWYGRLLETGGVQGRGLAPITVSSGPHRVLRGSLRLAVKLGWLDANPAAEARVPFVPRRPSTTPPAPAMFKFLGWLAEFDPECFAWCQVMASGARRVDVGVKWREWDEAGAELTLGARGVITARPDDPAALTDNAGRRQANGRVPVGGRAPRTIVMVRETPTAKRRLRKVALSRSANAALASHRARRLELAVMAGLGGLDPEGFVFAEGAAGTVPRRPDWMTGRFYDAKLAAAAAGVRGVERCRLYDVRHFMATESLAAGIEAAVLAERMGNSQHTIEHYYRHAAPAKDREAADIMDAIEAQAAAGRPATARARSRGPLRVVPDEAAGSES
jgi:hypothetical protein